MFGPINKTPALLAPVGILILGALYALLWFGTSMSPYSESYYNSLADVAL